MQQASRLTRKYQTTIPLPVRRKLGLKPGDAVVFEIENDTVTVRRATALDKEYAKSLEGTLTEWLSKEDDSYSTSAASSPARTAKRYPQRWRRCSASSVGVFRAAAKRNGSS
jgi:AbrB family looped-hinge helix DNA binding protein